MGIFLGFGAGCGTTMEPLLQELSFEGDLDGWESQASLSPEHLKWEIKAVAQPSLDKTGAARFFLDTTEGEGAIWLRKHIPVTISRDEQVNVSVSLHARLEGAPLQQPQLLFWVRNSAPFDRNSFTAKEALALTEAWNEYTFTERVRTSGRHLWFAFGIEAPQGGPTSVYLDNITIEVTE